MWIKDGDRVKKVAAGFLHPGHMETEIATLHHYINIWHLQSTVGCRIAGTVTVSVFIDIYISIVYYLYIIVKGAAMYAS